MSAPELEPPLRGDDRPGDSRYPTRSAPRGSLIVRAILWVAISLAFLVWNLWRMVQMRVVGLPVRWWAYAQVVLWVIALCFWLRTGWRDFQRREDRRG